MHGIQQEQISYVLKSDEGSKQEEKTTWHLKIMSALDAFNSTKRFSKAIQSDYKGKTEINEQLYKKALRANWMDAVISVDNYQFGYKFPELQAKGYINVTEPGDIEKILEDMPRDLVDELMDVSNKGSEISELDKKK